MGKSPLSIPTIEEMFSRALDNKKKMSYNDILMEVSKGLYNGFRGLDEEAIDGLIGMEIQEEGNHLMFLILYRWAKNGFQTFKIGHKLCAALMASTFSDEILANVQMPFNAFCIDIPEGILFSNEGGKTSPISKVLVIKQPKCSPAGGDLAYVSFNREFMLHWRHGFTANQMVSEVNVKDDLRGEFTKHDERLCLLIGRLIVGLSCMVTNIRNGMADPGEELKPANKSAYDRFMHARGQGKDFAQAEALLWKVTADIKVDLRDRVHRYLSGKGTGKSLEVRFVVQGHWKMQPFGPGHAHRKRIWIKPYEKGPKDAPMLVHGRVLKDNEV